MNLKPHQIKAIEDLSKRDRVLFTAKMGAGKTAITLSCIKKWGGKTLTVAPKEVCKTVWAEECEKWEHLKGLKCVKLVGDAQTRNYRLRHEQGDVYIVNKENLRWLMQGVKYYTDWPFDNLIIDESSCIKNYASKIFKEAIKPYVWMYSKVVLLSGTPAPNGYMDLWSQIYALDGGESLGKNITAYRTRYFDQNPYSMYMYKMKKGAENVIKNKVKHLTYSVEVPKMEPQVLDVLVEMPKKAKDSYKHLENHFTLGNVYAGSTAILVNKLLQVCNGFLYDTENPVDTLSLHDEKIKRLKEIVADNPTENFLVGYNYAYDRDRLFTAFPEAKLISDKGVIKDWNKGKVKIMLASPKSAGHGLNLQFGGSICVWFGLTWDLEAYQQFNCRLNRMGQKNTVRIIRLITEDTIETKVLGTLLQKEVTQNDLLDYIERTVKDGHTSEDQKLAS